MLGLKGIYYLGKAMMILQQSGGLFLIVNFIIWENLIAAKMTYSTFTINHVHKIK